MKVLVHPLNIQFNENMYILNLPTLLLSSINPSLSSFKLIRPRFHIATAPTQSSLNRTPQHVSHDNSNMIIHVLINVPQEAASDDADPAKSQTREVDPSVALGVGNLARPDDDGVGGFVAGDTGDLFEFFEEGGAC